MKQPRNGLTRGAALKRERAEAAAEAARAEAAREAVRAALAEMRAARGGDDMMHRAALALRAIYAASNARRGADWGRE